MKRGSILVLVVAAALALMVIAVALRGVTPDLWVQGSDPEDCPIVGMWILDGLPQTVVCVRLGERYYSYNPAGAVFELFTTPPAWWAPLPGSAR